MINAMSFSPCGGALAVAGEDCTVRIWDVSGASRKGPEIYKTNNVSICDLKYTKRNLLLALGDYDKH
jgi:WD40 repeat protein